MTPRQRSELYRVGVGFVALAIFAGTAGPLARERPDWWMVAALAVAGILALEFPLHVNISEKVSVATAVFFAALLLLPVRQAAVLVGAVQAIDICIAAVRKARVRKERPPMRAIASSIVFNGGQAYLSLLAAGAVLGLLGGLVGLLGAAAAMYAVNLGLVSVAVALGTSRNPLTTMLGTQRALGLQSAVLYALGAAAGLTTERYPWLLLLGVLPAVLVYHSLRERVEMRHEAMRAMERMAGEVDRRDPYTFQHSQRVAIYCHAIARRLGLSGSESSCSAWRPRSTTSARSGSPTRSS
jgi:hypothetical protein